MKIFMVWFSAALSCAAPFMVWVSGSGQVPTLTGASLTGIRWVLFLVVVLHVAGAAMNTLRGEVRIGQIASLGEIVSGLLALVILEVLPGLIPGAIVLRTVRRTALNFGAGPGPWLFVTAGLLSLLAPLVPDDLNLARIPRRAIVVLSGSMVIEALLISLRTEAWLSGTGASGSVSLQGRDLPWVGPLTLLLAFAFPAALAAYLVLDRWVYLLVPGAMTWLCAWLASIELIFIRYAHRIRISGLGDSVKLGDPSLVPSLYVATCVATAAAIGYCIASSESERSVT